MITNAADFKLPGYDPGRVVGPRISCEIKNGGTGHEASGGVPVKRKWWEIQSQTVHKQNHPLHQHKSAKPWNRCMKLPRPDHQDQKQTSYKSERGGCHSQPIIEHPIVGQCFRTHPPQRLLDCSPAQKDCNDRHSPGKRSATEEHAEDIQMHDCFYSDTSHRCNRCRPFYPWLVPPQLHHSGYLLLRASPSAGLPLRSTRRIYDALRPDPERCSPEE